MRFSLLYCIIILLLLTSCKSNTIVDIKPLPTTEPVTFHHYFSGQLSGGIDNMVDVYNNSQSDFELRAVPIDHEAYKINILNSFDSSAPSDLNSYWAGLKTQHILEYLEPLDELFEEGGLENKFNPSLLESSSKYYGHYYLVPITQHYICFYYNKELFQRLELSEPNNWEDFIDVCDTLSANGVTPLGLGAKDRWPAQFYFDYILLRTAGYDYRTKLLEGDASYTDPEVLRAIELWKELIDKGYFNENATDIDCYLPIINPMMNGEYGMTLNGTWLFSTLDSEGYEGQYDVFSFPIIDSDVPVAALGPVDGLIIGKDAINIQGAKETLLLLSNQANQKEMAIGSGGFSPSNEVDPSIYNPLQQELLTDMNNSDSWAFNYDLATAPQSADLGLDFFVEFLVFPDAYVVLLEELENHIE